ncbi:MAG: SAF domain-containing protein [Myxococcaceae bacterium]|nr:SAF domain-containing protein [Myxococcaceae bacterium]
MSRLGLLLLVVSTVSSAAEPVTAVVVAAVDLPAGSVITLEKVSQRLLPTEFVTRSMVRSDAASSIVEQRTRLPIVAGEPLLWTYLEASFRVPACATLEKDDRAEAQVARHRQVLRTRRAKAP